MHGHRHHKRPRKKKPQCSQRCSGNRLWHYGYTRIRVFVTERRRFPSSGSAKQQPGSAERESKCRAKWTSRRFFSITHSDTSRTIPGKLSGTLACTLSGTICLTRNGFSIRRITRRLRPRFSAHFRDSCRSNTSGCSYQNRHHNRE